MCLGSHEYFNAWSKLLHRSKSSTGMISTCLLSPGLPPIRGRGRRSALVHKAFAEPVQSSVRSAAQKEPRPRGAVQDEVGATLRAGLDENHSEGEVAMSVPSTAKSLSVGV